MTNLLIVILPVNPDDLIGDVLHVSGVLFEANKTLGKITFEEARLVFRRKMWFPERSVLHERTINLVYNQVCQFYLESFPLIVL